MTARGYLDCLVRTCNVIMTVEEIKGIMCMVDRAMTGKRGPSLLLEHDCIKSDGNCGH